MTVSGASFRLATFNLEDFGQRHASDVPLADRIGVLRPQILALDADILCVQEVNAGPTDASGQRHLDGLEALLDGTPYAAYHRASTEGPGGPRDIHNQVTLSRFPIVALDQIRHRHVPPPAPVLPGIDIKEIRWDRPILRTQIALPGGGLLHVLNLHLRAPIASPIAGAPPSSPRPRSHRGWPSAAAWAKGYWIAAQKALGQALEARLEVERILTADPDALVAVVGDINADRTALQSRMLLAAVEDTENPDLAGHALASVAERLPADHRFTLRHGGNRALFDQILVSQRLAQCLLDVAIDNDTLPDEKLVFQRGEAVAGSLHAPVSARFQVPDIIAD